MAVQEATISREELPDGRRLLAPATASAISWKLDRTMLSNSFRSKVRNFYRYILCDLFIRSKRDSNRRKNRVFDHVGFIRNHQEVIKMGHQAQVSLSKTVCFLGCESVDCESIASDVVAAGFRISGTFNDAQSFETFIARSGANPVVVIIVDDRTENQLGQIGKSAAATSFRSLLFLRVVMKTLAIRALSKQGLSLFSYDQRTLRPFIRH